MASRQNPHHHLYNDWRWRDPKKGRRARQLNAEPLCRMCLAQQRTTPATVADHIIPHKGDEQLFWKGELQSLCATHHNATKQSEEATGYRKGCDANGWPLDPNHPSWSEA